jgi:ABC-type transport system substrate-binding protein
MVADRLLRSAPPVAKLGAMSSDVRTGTVVAGFRVERLIGEGAMGAVYLADDPKRRCQVALKVLAPELARDERFRQRFLRESQIAASLDHSNVVATLAAGEEDGVLYLAMSYIDGLDLRQVLRSEGSLEPRRAVSLISQVAGALDDAHRRGLIHRDVKPGNILVAPGANGEHAFVCDFGLARHVSSVSSLTGERGFVGTIDYVSPEQIEGGTIDGRADVYSLGCVLFECLAGERPFDRESELSVVFAHLNEPPPRLSDLRPELPQAFDRVVATALAKAPGDRYATCGELAAAAAAAMLGAAVVRRKLADRRRVIVGGAVVAALAAVAGGVLATHRGGPSDIRGKAAATLSLRPNAVSLLDAKTHRIVGALPFAKRSAFGLEASDIAFAGGSAWVLQNGGQRLVRVDAATRKTTATVKLPWPTGGRIATGGGLVWVTEDAGQAVVGVDGRTGKIVRRFAVAGTNAAGVAYGDGSLWIAQGTNVARVDPRSGRVLRRIHNPGQSSSTVWLAYADGAVWSARASVGIIRKIDPVENRITAEGRLDGWISDLTVGDGFVWISKLPDGVVYRLSEDDLSVLGSYPSGPDPERISLGGGFVWVANASARTVSQLAEDSGARRRLAAAAEPTLVRYEKGVVWTGARPSPPPLPAIDGTEVRIALSGSMNAEPTQSGSILDEQRLYATCANLLGYPDTGGGRGTRLSPEVAAALPVVSQGGRRYTFRVRSGFRFSPPSNEAVTAETFRHTIERALSPKFGTFGFAAGTFEDIVGAAAYRVGKTAHVSGIAVRGDTISFTLVRPAGDFLTRLSAPYACSVPLSQPIRPRGTMRPVPSAGPYYTESIEGNRTVLLRNPNYGGDRPRRAERIVYTDDVPTQKAVALADAGALDYLPSANDPLAPGGPVARALGPGSAAARAGRQRYFLEPLPWFDGLVLNAGRPLFADVRLRRAVNYALDRKALAKAFDDAPSDQIVPPAVPGFRPGRIYPLEGPDIGAARRLAGLRPRRAVLWYCTNGVFGGPGQRRIAQMVRSELARIRIAVSITTSDCNQASRYDETSRSADLIMFSTGAPERDPAAFFDVALADGRYGSALGPGPWNEPSFRKRVAQARSLRGQARVEGYARLVRELMQAAPFAVYGSFVSSEYFSPKVVCKLFQPAGGFVDLGTLCVPHRASGVTTSSRETK